MLSSRTTNLLILLFQRALGLLLNGISHHSENRIRPFWVFFSKKDIPIPNVAEKNIMILVEEKKII